MAVERIDYASETEFKSALVDEDLCNALCEQEAQQKQLAAMAEEEKDGTYEIEMAKQKYQNDPYYQRLVEIMAQLMREHKINYGEAKQAVRLADMIRCNEVLPI